MILMMIMIVDNVNQGMSHLENLQGGHWTPLSHLVLNRVLFKKPGIVEW